MEYENNPQLPGEDGWMDEILDQPQLPQELELSDMGLNLPQDPELAEQELYDAGLIQPADPELEKILRETDGWEDDGVNGTEDTSAQDAALWSAMLDAMPDLDEDGEGFAMEEPVLAEESALEDERLVAPEPEPDYRAVFDETRRYDSSSGWTIPQDLIQPEEPAPAEEPVREETEEAAMQIRKKNSKSAAQSEKPAKPERKSRPRAKKGYGLFGLPHLLSSIIWLAIIVGIGVSLGRTLWVCAAEVLAFGKPDMSVTITITEADMEAEDTLERVAAKLKNAGLIDYPELFVKYAQLTDAEEEITAGTYTLKGTDDYMALVNSMNTYSGSRETVEVMIPEGYTCAQIFALLEEKGVCTAEELGEYAANGDLGQYWFLEGVERGSRYCLEGYLFPDTYEFYVGDDPGRVLTKMLGDSVGGFNVRFTDIMEEKLVDLNERLSAMMKKNGYNQDYIDQHQMTVQDVVIVASMIEKETTGSDRYDIASVIYNRLTDAGEFPYLNIDATIIYALGGKVDPVTGENIPLTEADMKIDSPYNTYEYKGLPPGPISNPGVYSLLAALDPNETDFHYYVYNPAIGAHKFSETYREHQDYINSMG